MTAINARRSKTLTPYLTLYQSKSELNKKITKKVLEDMKNVKISIQTYRNYVLIAIGFQIDGKLVEEKLPAVSLKEYESPLVASVAA